LTQAARKHDIPYPTFVLYANKPTHYYLSYVAPSNKNCLTFRQAARKHDIPYPTFVLYANRVHNMLGPSVLHGLSGGAAMKIQPAIKVER
jgi:hypothetical protein